MRLLSTKLNLLVRLSYSQRNNFKKVVIVTILFNSQSVFGQIQSATPQKVKTTETGVEIYEGVGVEGLPTKNLENKSTSEFRSKSIQEYSLEECVNSLTDVDNKIRIIQNQSGSQEEINQYILFKNQLIQRKQALINQQITK